MKKKTFRFVEGLKSQQVQDFVITQIRNEKEEQHLDIPVRRVLEIVKTLEAEEDIENEYHEIVVFNDVIIFQVLPCHFD